MKNRFIWLATVLCIGLFANTVTAATRTSESINRDWTFTLGDPPDAQAIDRDTTSWRRVDLPHSFSEPYFLGTGFYVGHGWYRRNLDLRSLRGIGIRLHDRYASRHV